MSTKTSFNIFIFLFLISNFCINLNGNSQEKIDLKIFPPSKEDYEQVIIELPKKNKENNLKIEVLVGKMAETDACNSYFLMGELQEQNLAGWGYTYYEFLSEGHIGSTLMLCPEDKTTLKFVSAEGILQNYNSKLPIVVYIPKGMEVKYRIWSTKDKWKSTK